MNLLQKVLALPDFKHYEEITKDDYRDPNIDNAPFSISSNGYFDHRTNISGSLFDLLPQVNIKKIYDESKPDIVIVKAYFKSRSLRVSPGEITKLGCRVNIYNDKRSIITPLLSTKGELIQLHTIPLNDKNEKEGKSHVLGKNYNQIDRAIVLSSGKTSRKKLVIEGLEDAIALRDSYQGYTIVISSGAKQFKRVRKFITNATDVIVLLDPDPDQASMKHSFYLGNKAKRLLPSLEYDANEAVKRGLLDEWLEGLKVVPFSEVKALNDDAKTEIERGIFELNEKHAVISIEGKVVILNNKYDPMFKRWGISFSSQTDFTLKYMNKHINIVDDKGDIKNVPLTKLWLRSGQRKEYEGLAFDPTETVDSDEYFNVWRGWPFEPGKGNCDLYYDHIFRNLANSNQQLYDYILNWMADGIQNPTKKPGVAIIVRGGQGTGKGVFIDWYRLLFGQHGLYIRDIKHLVGTFNAHLKECLLLFADEIFVTHDKNHESTLKGLISESVHMIEYKGKDVFQFPNYIRLMMSSNERYVAPLDTDNRRYFILDISRNNVKDYVYFAALEKQMLKENGLQQLMKDLLERDLSGINVKNFPDTVGIIENKIASFGSVQEWIYQMLDNDALPVMEGMNALYEDYKKACGDKKPRSKNQWSSELKDHLPSVYQRQQAGKKGRFLVFQDLETHQAEFCHFIGMNVNFKKQTYQVDNTFD